MMAGDDGPRTKAQRRLETDAFLISHSGGQLEGESVASVLDRLSVCLQEQGFAEAHLHAHLFRHDYITRKALDGENPSVLKRWIRHRTFSMTDRYFGVGESKLAAVRPKRSVLEGIVPLPQKRRGRPTEKRRTGKFRVEASSGISACSVLVLDRLLDDDARTIGEHPVDALASNCTAAPMGSLADAGPLPLCNGLMRYPNGYRDTLSTLR